MKKTPVYEIRVKGTLGNGWATWFDGMAIRRTPKGDTVLHGPIQDQAALHSILLKIRSLGLELISVNQVGPSDEKPNTRSS